MENKPTHHADVEATVKIHEEISQPEIGNLENEEYGDISPAALANDDYQ